MEKRVLVVDDNEAIRVMVAKVLARNGFAVDAAAGGHLALRKLEESSYGAVVLDLFMPDMNGYEVLSHIERVSSRACVVIMTASSQDTIDHIHQECVLASLRKPFDLKELVATVERCFAEGP